MTRNSPALLRILGVAHIVVAIVLLPVGTFFGIYSAVVFLPALIWLAVLGFRLWWPGPRLRTALRYTHFVLVPAALLLVVYGLFALGAAQRSAGAGGGLLGAFGLIPLVMGLLAGSLSLVSLYVSSSTAFMGPAATGSGLDKNGPTAATQERQ